MVVIDHVKCLKKNPKLLYDEACLDIISKYNKDIRIDAQYTECYLCETQEWVNITANGSASVLIDTKYPLKINFNDGLQWCNTIYNYEEHGRYGWNISGKGDCTEIYVKEAPDNAYLPILGAVIFFLLFGTIWYGVKCVYKSTCTSSIRTRLARFSELEADLGSPQTVSPVTVAVAQRRPGAGRVKSLDVFRGLAISLMIFVNYGGGQYSFFKHSIWNGLTVADLVFPWFAWIMGVSIALSSRSALRAGISRRRLTWRAIRRCIILICLGLALNTVSVKHRDQRMDNIESIDPISKAYEIKVDQWGTENYKVRDATRLDYLRLPGVLQRLGLAGLIVSLLEIIFMHLQSQHQQTRFSFLTDVLESWAQWVIVGLLVVVHTCITFLLPVPGCPTGYIGPGGLHQRGAHKNCTGGAAGYIDRAFFGERHIYQHPTCEKMYRTETPYDPEGLLGTLTTVFIVYMGVQAGRIMLTYNSPSSRIIRWLSWATISGLAAGILCNFSKNGGFIPINKNLWSLSFVLATGSMAFVVQTILYVMVDVTRRWGGRPLFYPGMNAIFLFAGHELAKNMFPWAWQPKYYSHRELLVMNLWATFVWIAIAIFLYKKRIFLTI